MVRSRSGGQGKGYQYRVQEDIEEKRLNQDDDRGYFVREEDQSEVKSVISDGVCSQDGG